MPRSRSCPRGCDCIREGRWCHGFHAATLDFDRIQQWWGSRPDLGVGVATGPAGLVVIDIDAHACELPDRDRLLPGVGISAGVDLTGLANGFHTLGVLAALRGAASPADDESTLRVRTPSGGSTCGTATTAVTGGSAPPGRAVAARSPGRSMSGRTAGTSWRPGP